MKGISYHMNLKAEVLNNLVAKNLLRNFFLFPLQNIIKIDSWQQQLEMFSSGLIIKNYSTSKWTSCLLQIIL